MKIFKSNISKWVVGACLLAVSTTSCNDAFLEKVPTSRVSPETVFATTDNALTAINGMHKHLYAQWYSTQIEGGQSGNILYMEALGDDMVMNGSSSWLRSEYRWLSQSNENSSLVRFNYGFYFVFVGNANQIIANIDNAVGPDNVKANIKAQALAYRAWAYYQMIQLYGARYVKGGDNSGLGLPIVTEPTSDAIPRSSVEDVYTQINKDIDDAIALFASATNRTHKSNWNIDAVKGLKARVALTTQDYANAAKYAAEARQGYRLMNPEEYSSGFSKLSLPEAIWGFEHIESQTTYFYSFFAQMGNFSSTFNRNVPKIMNASLFNEIEDTDVRKTLWDNTGADEDWPYASNFVRAQYAQRKFILESPASSNGDYMLMRASEMYLIEAEALARLGGRDSEAADALYTMAVARDPEYTKSTNTGQALIDEILIQRRIELWGEGFRFYDLKRLNLPLDRTTATNMDVSNAITMQVPAGDPRWTFKIPQGEIDRTSGVVVQNPL